MDHIARDLKSLNKEIEKEIRVLSDSPESDLKLWRREGSRRALITLKAAAGGTYRTASLKPLAIALELLALGVNKHFGDGRPQEPYGAPAANVALVTADAYYVRALSLVVSLDDDRLVKALCDALATVSEGYVYPDAPDAGEKQAAFDEAAYRLGSLLGGNETPAGILPDDLVKEIKNAVFPYSS